MHWSSMSWIEKAPGVAPWKELACWWQSTPAWLCQLSLRHECGEGKCMSTGRVSDQLSLRRTPSTDLHYSTSTCTTLPATTGRLTQRKWLEREYMFCCILLYIIRSIFTRIYLVYANLYLYIFRFLSLYTYSHSRNTPSSMLWTHIDHAHSI